MKNETAPHRAGAANDHRPRAVTAAGQNRKASPFRRQPSKIAPPPGGVKRIGNFFSRLIARIDVSNFPGSCCG